MPMGKIYKYTKKSTKKQEPTMAIKKYVNNAIYKNMEFKYSACVITSIFSSIPTTWVESDLTSVNQGDTGVTRDGSQIQVHAVQIDAVLSNGDNRNTIRVILALWDHTSDSPLADNAAGIDSIIIKQNINGYTDGMIRKYVDQYITFTEPYDGGDDIKRFKYYKRFKKPLLIRFSTGGTTNSKRLILSMISDSGAVPNPGVINGHAHILFTDA